MLFAVIDANSSFSFIDIGVQDVPQGKMHFSSTTVGRNLRKNAYNLPLPSKISDTGPELPYVFVGDKQFPLTTSMLGPYPNQGSLDLPKQVFNYRVNRALKCADCAFSILLNQWKVFQKKFSTNAANTIKIAKAAICLHNFLMLKENARPFQDRRYSLLPESSKKAFSQGCTAIPLDSEVPSKDAEDIRNQFQELFCEDGAISLEWE